MAVVAAGVTAFLLWPKPPVPPKPPDLDGAVAHNTRGVALMEQRKDAEAEVEFAKAIDLAPDWLPTRINYGMALFNQQPAETKELAVQVKKAQGVFAEVLVREPDNRYAHYCLGMIDMYVGKYPDAYPHFQKVNQLDPDDAHTWLRLGSTHPDGPDSPNLALLKFIPDTADYWDAPNSKMIRTFGVIASIVAGKPLGLGEHGSVNGLSSAAATAAGRP